MNAAVRKIAGQVRVSPLEERRSLSEDDQIDISPEPVGQLRLKS